MGVGLRFGVGPLRVYVPLIRGGRRRGRGGRRRTTHWTHPGCTIRHQTEGAANRCRVGRNRPASSAAARPPAPTGLAEDLARLDAGARALGERIDRFTTWAKARRARLEAEHGAEVIARRRRINGTILCAAVTLVLAIASPWTLLGTLPWGVWLLLRSQRRRREAAQREHDAVVARLEADMAAEAAAATVPIPATPPPTPSGRHAR